MLNMDAPTADQLDIPVQAKKYRDVAKSLEEAPTWESKMMGVMIAGIGMLCFLAHTRLGGGANLSCTCLYLTLIFLHENGYPLGYLFRLLLDNTTSENKCNETIFFICWLVQRDYFADTSFFCMLKGHTYTGLDRTFNTMFMYLKQIGIYTISAMVNAIFRSLQKHDCLKVIELHALWDWGKYFEPHVSQRLGGFATSQYGSGMHEFYVRKDSEGVVRLWMRKSSQASGWMPEGPGMEVFSSVVPAGEPPLADHIKTELEWKRNAVEGTLRQWFRFMVVKSEAEGSEIREEWRTVFQNLPAQDNPNNLAEQLKPKWKELPRVTRAAEEAAAERGMGGASSALENPPVNPVHGPGRTETEVQRETHGYRQYVRRLNINGATPAVFQKDYVFVQLASCPVFLARVVGNAYIDESTNERISIKVGEYDHKPQPRVQGFFGTFTKKPNAAYNANDKRTGGKFVRHANITRDEIVLYDVKTYVDRELMAQNAADEAEPEDCVRVAPSSLRKLAAVRPEFSMPDRLPRSHVERDNADAEIAAAAAQRQQNGDDPAAPIPQGFHRVEWQLGDPVGDFLIWTNLGESRQWHSALVIKAHPPNFRGGYTHDARFPDGIRGVRLTEQVYREGCWVPIARDAPAAAARAPAAAARAPEAGRRNVRRRTH